MRYAVYRRGHVADGVEGVVGHFESFVAVLQAGARIASIVEGLKMRERRLAADTSTARTPFGGAHAAAAGIPNGQPVAIAA